MLLPPVFLIFRKYKILVVSWQDRGKRQIHRIAARSGETASSRSAAIATASGSRKAAPIAFLRAKRYI
jgi:hypothetical protein